MNVKFYIDTKAKVITEAFYGSISMATVQKAIPHIWNHPDYHIEYDGIIDLRESKLILSKAELFSLIEYIATDDRGMRGKAAVLVSEPMAAAMATIYGEQMKDFHAVGIFCSNSEVVRYLEMDESIFDNFNHPDAISIDLSK